MFRRNHTCLIWQSWVRLNLSRAIIVTPATVWHALKEKHAHNWSPFAPHLSPAHHTNQHNVLLSDGSQWPISATLGPTPITPHYLTILTSFLKKKKIKFTFVYFFWHKNEMHVISTSLSLSLSGSFVLCCTVDLPN